MRIPVIPLGPHISSATAISSLISSTESNYECSKLTHLTSPLINFSSRASQVFAATSQLRLSNVNISVSRNLS